jgi:hypothetical protein
MTGQALADRYRQSRSTLRLVSLGEAHLFETGGANTVTIQASLEHGTSWGSGVLTVERSNNGVDFVALATATTISGDSITTLTPDTAYMRVVVSTAGSSGVTVRVTSYVTGNP